jgi:hypothetical protein
VLGIPRMSERSEKDYSVDAEGENADAQLVVTARV